jgi:two-component system sporulation sensor kinase B
MAHEVRNGLGTIVGYARLLERSGTGEAADAARNILAECATLETVVRRFMDFVRRETLRLTPFDLPRTLSRVVAREGRGREGRITLGASEEVGTVTGDEELLERAFENLIRNALEAGGPHGQVEVWARREGESVVVTVSDDGPGLSRETRGGPRPFHSTKPGGLGLGLPIAIKIVRLHEGELVLGNRVPRGLEVTVRLPAQRSAV